LPSIELPAGPFYYRASGEGSQNLLLLHEYFGTGESWAAQRGWLARFGRVITPDLRGHGQSVVDPESRISVSGIVSDLTALLDTLELQRVHIVGCSLGAIAGMRLCQLVPERVASLVVSSIPDINDPGARHYAHEYEERIFPRIEKSLERVHGAGRPGYVRQLLLRNFVADIEERPDDHNEALSSASDIQQPVLVISGERDPVFPPQLAIQLVEDLANGSLAVLPDTGHLVHQEMPGIFNQLLLERLLRNQAG
jgi:pimeloyl-ACP methyl ester carboxylesterase